MDRLIAYDRLAREDRFVRMRAREVGELKVANGVITHVASNRSTTYGKVAAAAAKLTPPDSNGSSAT